MEPNVYAYLYLSEFPSKAFQETWYNVPCISTSKFHCFTGFKTQTRMLQLKKLKWCNAITQTMLPKWAVIQWRKNPAYILKKWVPLEKNVNTNSAFWTGAVRFPFSNYIHFLIHHLRCTRVTSQWRNLHLVGNGFNSDGQRVRLTLKCILWIVWFSAVTDCSHLVS